MRRSQFNKAASNKGYFISKFRPTKIICILSIKYAGKKGLLSDVAVPLDVEGRLVLWWEDEHWEYEPVTGVTAVPVFS